MELYVVNNSTAKENAEALLQHCGRFGAPNRLRSDQDSHFINEVIKEFLMLLGMDHIRAIAYSIQENAVVERANKEVTVYD